MEGAWPVGTCGGAASEGVEGGAGEVWVIERLGDFRRAPSALLGPGAVFATGIRDGLGPEGVERVGGEEAPNRPWVMRLFQKSPTTLTEVIHLSHRHATPDRSLPASRHQDNARESTELVVDRRIAVGVEVEGQAVLLQAGVPSSEVADALVQLRETGRIYVVKGGPKGAHRFRSRASSRGPSRPLQNPPP